MRRHIKGGVRGGYARGCVYQGIYIYLPEKGVTPVSISHINTPRAQASTPLV